MNNRNSNNRSIYYLDKILPLLPSYDPFILSQFILENLEEPEKGEANNLSQKIAELLVEDVKYANDYNGRLWIKLNDVGREAQELGGHFKYLEYLKENNKTKHTTISTQNNIGVNRGKAIFSGQKSRFENFDNPLPTQAPNTPTINKDQKGYWLVNILINNWTVTIVGGVVAAIIAGYIMWKLGIGH